MNTREKILAAINQNKPMSIPMPYFDFSQLFGEADRVERFIEALEYIGARVIRTENLECINRELERNEKKGLAVVNQFWKLRKKVDPLIFMKNAADLEGVHISCMEGILGVAENGAIWINEWKMGNR